MTEFLVKTASAAGLVPECDPTTTCGENQLLELGIKVIQFMIDTAFVLTVLFFLWGGFLLLTSGGSPNRVEQGKKAITGAVIGLVIVLTSVVVVNTFIATFTKCNRDAQGHYDFSKIGTIECPGLIQETQKIK